MVLLSGLRILHFCKLQHRSQMYLRTCVAEAVLYASGYGSYSIPSPGTSICHRSVLLKKQEKKKEEREQCREDGEVGSSRDRQRWEIETKVR